MSGYLPEGVSENDDHFGPVYEGDEDRECPACGTTSTVTVQGWGQAGTLTWTCPTCGEEVTEYPPWMTDEEA